MARLEANLHLLVYQLLKTEGGIVSCHIEKDAYLKLRPGGFY
jgi:hypothetical protein